DSAARAIERLHDGDANGLLLVVDQFAPGAQPRLVPAGARPLADFVRARVRGVQNAVNRMLAGMVMVDGGWRTAIERALAPPDFVGGPPGGDRRGGGLRGGTGSGAAAPTHRALEEAVAHTGHAEAARGDAAARVERARARLDTARAAATDLLAFEHR